MLGSFETILGWSRLGDLPTERSREGSSNPEPGIILRIPVDYLNASSFIAYGLSYQEEEEESISNN